jgi:hypothetical protein
MVLQWKILVHFNTIWYSLLPFGTFYGHLVYLWLFGIFYGYLVYFIVIWYLFPALVCSSKKKSGNPVQPHTHATMTQDKNDLSVLAVTNTFICTLFVATGDNTSLSPYMNMKDGSCVAQCRTCVAQCRTCVAQCRTCIAQCRTMSYIQTRLVATGDNWSLSLYMNMKHGSCVAQCCTCVAQCRTCVAQCRTCVAQCRTCVAQCRTCVAQCCTCVAQCRTCVAQCCTCVAQCRTCVAQCRTFRHDWLQQVTTGHSLHIWTWNMVLVSHSVALHHATKVRSNMTRMFIVLVSFMHVHQILTYKFFYVELFSPFRDPAGA